MFWTADDKTLNSGSKLSPFTGVMMFHVTTRKNRQIPTTKLNSQTDWTKYQHARPIKFKHQNYLLYNASIFFHNEYKTLLSK